MAGISSLKLDGETALALKRGDPIAQAEAYRVLSPGVMGMAMRILGDRGLAEEVVQDTFVTVLERADTLRDAGAVVGWVRQTAVNHCLMRLRSPWFRRRAGEFPAEPVDPAHSQARTEGLHDLELALGRMGAETRMVLWLHDVEGYTHQEIGALFGKTSSFSKSQLARGYRKLLDLSGDENDVGFAGTADIGPACLS
jgi:RNA polymerase sigma-70 factor (ECF subfamily)